MEPLRGSAIGDFFLRFVPEPFLAGIVGRADGAYGVARDFCRSNLSNESARGAMGDVKRAALQDALALLAKRTGVQSRWVANAIGSDLHLELRAGPVLMTVASVESPGMLPAQADYRETLARDAQLAFQGADWGTDDTVVSEDALLFALITHGRMEGLFTPPGFVNIVFPNSACTKILDSIPLFRRYADDR